MLGTFLKDYGELISITLIPFILWYLGIRFQDRKSKIDAKMNLFLTLMTNRGSFPPNREWVDSLNQIDIVFQDNKKIRSAWLLYFDSLHPSSQHNKNSNSFKLDLLSEIANELKYKDLKQTEIDRFYSPQIFSDQLTNQGLLTTELIRVLSNSQSFSETLVSDVDTIDSE